MNYNLIGEDDDKFVLGNGDNQFSVAKYGLDDGFMEKLRMLPRAYADGGMVDEPLPPAPSFAGASPPPEESAPLPEAPAIVEPSAPITPSITMPPPAPKPEAEVTTEPTAPKAPGYLELTKSMVTPQATAPTSTPQAGQAYLDAFNKMQSANMGIAAANAEAANAAMKAQDESMAELKKLQVSYESNLKNLDDEQKTLQTQVMNTKIDPNKVWTNMSTGNRVLAGISILLGGLAQGLTGEKSNPAFDVINQAIDRDIDAQKSDLGRKQNLLSLNLAKYGRLDAATAATRAQLLSVTQAQISQSAAKANNAIALKQAELANAQLDIQKAQLLQSVASQQSLQNVLSQPGGIAPQMVNQLPMDVRETLVKMPSGNFAQAKDKASAVSASKGLETVGAVQSLVQRAKDFMSEGRALPLLESERIGQADVISEALRLEIKNLGALGVLSGEDNKIIDRLKPQLNEYTFRDQEMAKADELNQYINMKIDGYLKQNIPGYAPSAIQATKVFK